jgi:hypothetical protein
MAKFKRKKKSTPKRRAPKRRARRTKKAPTNGRRLRRNPARRTYSRRRLRRNDASGDPLMAIAAAERGRSEPMSRPGRGFKGKWRAGVKIADAKQRKRVAKSLRTAATALSKSAKKSKGITRTVKSAQAARLRATAALVTARGRGAAVKSQLAKAMSIKTNPGLEGLKSAAMVLVPQAGVGAVGLIGLAMAGRQVAKLVTDKMDAGSAVRPYVPAIATAGLSVVAYVVADKVAPKYKGAIAIGGMLAAVIQAIVAASDAAPGGMLAKAKAALTGDTVAATGEYTTVGSGMFRGTGEYTTVGNAHPFRPRNYGDDQMEWASDSRGGLSGGADNATEFAPGEGGILSGQGMFR